MNDNDHDMEEVSQEDEQMDEAGAKEKDKQLQQKQQKKQKVKSFLNKAFQKTQWNDAWNDLAEKLVDWMVGQFVSELEKWNSNESIAGLSGMFSGKFDAERSELEVVVTEVHDNCVAADFVSSSASFFWKQAQTREILWSWIPRSIGIP